MEIKREQMDCPTQYLFVVRSALPLRHTELFQFSSTLQIA
jgi:hypothetical protein